MVKVYLIRTSTSDEGTFGHLIADNIHCYTGELPDRGNKPNMSCIPEGSYRCEVVKSPHFKMELYHVTNVPNRSKILIHAGNWCGDRKKGYRSDSYGCILLGLHKGVLMGQKAVIASKTALNAFMAYMEYKPFILEVKNGF